MLVSREPSGAISESAPAWRVEDAGGALLATRGWRGPAGFLPAKTRVLRRLGDDALQTELEALECKQLPSSSREDPERLGLGQARTFTRPMVTAVLVL